MPSTKAAKQTKTSAAPKVARSRTSATEKHFIPNYPKKLFIYKLPASQYWWARYFVNGNAVRKSTKTQGKREAMEFAKTFYDTITYNARHGFAATMSASSFEGCMKEMLKAEKAKVSRGELSKISYDNSVYRYNKSITPYFGRMEVRDINYMAVDGYLNELSKKDLSSSTITAYLGLTRKVLSYAAKRNLITAVPEFPSVRLVDKARGWFTWREYILLWRRAGTLCGKTIEVRKHLDAEGVTQTQYIDAAASSGKVGKLMRNVVMTEDLRRLIVFMVNSYIRPTDIKFMQHKHVDVMRGRNVYLRLRIPPTKGHSDAITTMPKAVNVYEVLREHHLATGAIGKDYKEDYVFLPQYKNNRDYALKQLQRQWEVLMHSTGLDASADGEERTLYSLRHTCIMWRLLLGEGINTLALARNARTSVEMIDRFYAKPLSGEMNIEMLQSRRRPRAIFDGES
jgi:integrase